MNEIEHATVQRIVDEEFIMGLAVTDNGELYACTVFYATTDGHILYFKSRTASNHSRLILRNRNVAGIIYSSTSTYTNKRGIQFLGSVERVYDFAEASMAVELY